MIQCFEREERDVPASQANHHLLSIPEPMSNNPNGGVDMRTMQVLAAQQIAFAVHVTVHIKYLAHRRHRLVSPEEP